MIKANFKHRAFGVIIYSLLLGVVSPIAASYASETWTWTLQNNAGSRNWHSISASADGSKLYAGVGNNKSGSTYTTGYLYSSSDYGVTWTELTSAGNRTWWSIATNLDGTRVAAIDKYGSIWTSADSGSTWQERQNGGAVHNWNGLASSSDGSKLVAITSDRLVFASSNFGATWAQITGPTFDTSSTVFSVKSSDDGSTIAISSIGGIYISSDSGATWRNVTPTSGLGNPSWTYGSGGDTPYFQSIALSSDGSHLVTGTRVNNINNGGIIFTSSDYGATWTSRRTGYDYIAFASNGDGTKLAAAIYAQSLIATSADSGATWSNVSAGGIGMLALASNIDGSLLFTSSYGGGLYTGKIPNIKVNIAPPASTSLVIAAATNTPATSLTFSATANSKGVVITPIANPTLDGSTPFDASTASIFDIAVVNLTGQVTVCVDGGPSLRLWHYTNGAWVDVTTSQTATQTCGLTSSFSPFATGSIKVSAAEVQAALKAASDAAARAAAEAAAAKREAEKKAARADITSNLKNSKDLSVETFVSAEIAGINSTNIASVQAELLALPEESRADINQVLKVARKYEIVGNIGSDRINYLQSNTFVEIGLIPASSKNKVALVAAVRKLPESARDTYIEIKAVIDAETAKLKARSDRLAAIISRNASRNTR
jgi:photosystem II stability/assembly factor-like uncharacterized protein